jgi:epoxyqueuosine reductase
LDYAALKSRIHAWADKLGFQQLGITDVDLSAHAPHVRAWLEKGFHGEMGYLNRNLIKRLQPELLEPQTCRVISARMDYLAQDTNPLRVLSDNASGYVSRYALGRDYHKVLRRRLARLGGQINEATEGFDLRFRAFTDSAPVLEKALAEKAGLGWIGKHSVLLNREAGSWFFLGEIYTNIPLPVDKPQTTGYCGKCSACMSVCPTGAIVGPKQLDARKCISYLTIEHKTAIPEEFRAAIGNRVFGCDDCQLFCPWNRYAQFSAEPDFAPRHGLAAAPLTTLFAWSEADFLRYTEGSALRRISYEQWLRNVAVALGNGPPTPQAISLLENRRADVSAMVREHIDWALVRLRAQARPRAATPDA